MSTGMHGLPLDVRFCSRCVISTQRMSSVVERTASPSDPKPTIAFDAEGVCSACRYHERMKTIDWAAREKMLAKLCEEHQVCLVPGSGGKDSMYAAHLLKTKYGMEVTTVTAAAILYTDIGRKNHEAFTRIADNIMLTPGDYRERTRDAFLRFGHCFKPFIEEQKRVAPLVSRWTGIPLVFYGEPPAMRGGNEHELDSPVMDPKYYEEANYDTEVHYLGWYLPWSSQANYYYAVEHCGFTPNTERTEGSYSKLSSLDDKVDVLHYWLTLAKTGIGRATYNACEDIRDGFLTREEAVMLVKRYDQEKPRKFLPELLDYLGLTEAEFDARVDAARPPHLWEKVGGEWVLKHAAWR